MENRDMTAKLDVKGLNCPIPILKVKKAFMKMKANDVLEVETTDPGSVVDFGVFCRTKGHTLVESTEKDGVFTFVLSKGS